MSDIQFDEISHEKFSDFIRIKSEEKYFGCLSLDQRESDRWFFDPHYVDMTQEQLEQILNKLKELNGDV